MTLHKNKDEVCPHMQELLSCHADSKLTGIPLWYTRLHLSHCADCTKALEELHETIGVLRMASPSKVIK
jgi:hypothetical protein